MCQQDRAHCFFHTFPVPRHETEETEGIFGVGWSMSRNSGLEGSTSPQDQPSSSWKIIALIETWQLVKICPCPSPVKYFLPSICERTKRIFPGSKCGGRGGGKQEMCAELREKGKAMSIQVITRAQDVLFHLQSPKKPANKGKLCFKGRWKVVKETQYLPFSPV